MNETPRSYMDHVKESSGIQKQELLITRIHLTTPILCLEITVFLKTCII